MSLDAVGTMERMEAQLVARGNGMGTTKKKCHLKILIKKIVFALHL